MHEDLEFCHGLAFAMGILTHCPSQYRRIYSPVENYEIEAGV